MFGSLFDQSQPLWDLRCSSPGRPGSPRGKTISVQLLRTAFAPVFFLFGVLVQRRWQSALAEKFEIFAYFLYHKGVVSVPLRLELSLHLVLLVQIDRVVDMWWSVERWLTQRCWESILALGLFVFL